MTIGTIGTIGNRRDVPAKEPVCTRIFQQSAFVQPTETYNGDHGQNPTSRRSLCFQREAFVLIPHEWIEAESGDSEAYLYRAPDGGSGWLRVSLITTKGVADPWERVEKLFSKSEKVTRNKLTGNLIRRSEKDTVEDGDRLRIYYWFVGGIMPPDIACEAVFSYTVLAENVSESTTKSEIQVLDQLLSKARFHAVDENRPS